MSRNKDDPPFDPQWDRIEKHGFFKSKFEFGNVGEGDDEEKTNKATPDERNAIREAMVTTDVEPGRIPMREGGSGSGNFGHSGRAGERGGSSNSGAHNGVMRSVDSVKIYDPSNHGYSPRYKLQKLDFKQNKWITAEYRFATRRDSETFFGEFPEYANPEYRVIAMSPAEYRKFEH